MWEKDQNSRLLPLPSQWWSRYQIILLGDRDSLVWTTCPRSLPGSVAVEVTSIDKKFELMLTRCSKAYKSSCSQIALVYLQPLCRNWLLKCAAQPTYSLLQKNNVAPYFRSSGSFKVIDVDTAKNSSLVFVVVFSIAMPICNCFHDRLANNGKITTFIKYRSLRPSCAGFLEPRRLRLRSLKSKFNAENFVCSLSKSICSEFSKIRSSNVSCSPKSPKNP